MQDYEKCGTDARSFPEIWESLTPVERAELRHQLIKNVGVTRQTVDNWSKGVTPIMRDIRVKVARCFGQALNIHVSHTTLFPNVR